MANKERIKKLAKYSLPSTNKELLGFINSHRVPMMEQTIASIAYAIENELPMVEVFQFDESEFVITLSEKDYLNNINNIYQFYMDAELYELCSRVVVLQKFLSEKQIYNNEKESTKK